MRIDKIACSAGEIWEIEYYSKFLFQTSGGTFQQTTSANTDLVNLDTNALNLFEFECAITIAQQLQGRDSSIDIQFFRRELGLDEKGNIIGGLYAGYIQNHPSEAIRQKEIYYDVSLY